tara:strand:- start:12222 stop:12746 length:525 start_codon:yes stop_codon:yes gene_type:complete
MITVMKNTFLLVFTVLFLFSCKEKEENTSPQVSQEIARLEPAQVYGEDFKNVKTLNGPEVGDIYKNLAVGDTVNVTFQGPVADVCKAKGCWMKVDIGTTEKVMVKFKDYGFFVPKDIEEQQVTVHGRAYIAEVPVDEQKHLAKDAGKSDEEIEKITQPARTLAFVADGVKIGNR